jgi:DNA polymerase III subunit delta'
MRMAVETRGALGTPPRANLSLLGHEEAERRVEHWILQDRLPHALLICGPWGIGKSTMAFRIARRLLQRTSLGRRPSNLTQNEVLPPIHRPLQFREKEDETARWIASGTHPDLLIIERGIYEKGGRAPSEIVIGDVRKIGGFLTSSPALGGWRVVIIDSADEMNRNAANALLKVLEEPTTRSLLILVAHQPGLIPATVRSRCRKLLLRPLSDDVLRELAAGGGLDLTVEDLTVLIELAEGSIGRMLHLANHEGLVACRFFRAFFQALSSSDKPTLLALVANKRLGSDEEGFRVALHILFWWLRRIARACMAKSPTMSIFPGLDCEEWVPTGRLSVAAALDHWLKVWEKTYYLVAQVDAGNLDRKQVFTTILLDVQRELQTAAL